MSDNHWTQFAEHRTGAEINQLLHYRHVIPIRSLRTQEYVATHFPGWEWNDLMAIWRSAGIVVSPSTGSPAQCNEHVAAIHFNNANSFAVEWVDGTVTIAGGSA